MPMTKCVSIFMILCAVIASSVSTAIPHWITESEIHEGLWEVCGIDDGVPVCLTLTGVHVWVNTIRAFMIIGTSLLEISLFLACSFARNLSSHGRVNGCVFCLISGGILLITAVIVFARKVDLGDTMSYDSAYYLAIAAAVVAMFTALEVHKAKSTSRDGYTVHA